MIRIPKKIHFCGLDYKIIQTNHLDAGENYGRSDVSSQEIHISKELSEEKKMETLFHEIFHLAYLHTSKVLSHEQEENLIKPLSLNFFGIMKDNKLI